MVLKMSYNYRLDIKLCILGNPNAEMFCKCKDMYMKWHILLTQLYTVINYILRHNYS